MLNKNESMYFFLASIELIENKSKMVKLNKIEKAISQDINKMLFAAKKSQ